MIKSTRLRATLSASTILAAGLLLVVAPARAQSLPDTGNVSVSTRGLSGGAPGSTNPGFSTSGAAGAQTLRVDLKDNRTILNWGGAGFNVAAGNTVDFKDARATAGVTGRTDNIAVLNRDLSGSPSFIIGALKSDPNIAVYVINRSGLVLGDSGSTQSAISTGSFFASNADIGNDNSFLNGATTLSFSQPPRGGAQITLGNVRITTASNGGTTGGRLGDIVLIGNDIVTSSPTTPAVIDAAGDVLIANAITFTFLNAPGSPLSLSVTEAGHSSVMYSDITARNVTIGNYYAGDGNSASFYYRGSITATGATATDRGVVLYAQSTDANSPVSPLGPMWTINQNQWAQSIISAKDVSFTGANFFNDSAITAVGDAILGSAGHTFNTTKDVIAGTITINATSGQFYNLKATVGDILFNGAANFALQGDVDAARDLLFPSIKMLGISSTGRNSIKAGRNISITASDGIGSLGTYGAKIDAGGYISIKQTAPTGTLGIGFADLLARGGSVTIDAAGSVDGGSLTAADRVDVTAGGAITLRGLTGPNGIKLTSLGTASVQGNIQIASAIATGANADIVVTTPGAFITNLYNSSATPVIDAGRDISVQASGTAPSITTYGVNLSNARAGRNIQVSGIGIGASDLVATTGFISLTNAGGPLQVDRNLRAGQYIVGNGTRVSVSNAVAGHGTIMLTANAGDLTFQGASSATGSITLNATGKMNLYATSVDAGGDLIASGRGVDIRSTYGPATGFPALSIKAAGAISINAGTGSVTNNFGRGVIQSNSDGIGTEALTIESGGQLFLNSDLLGGTDRESDVRLRFDSSQGFALRGIRARSLLGASGTDPFTNGLVTTSFVGLNGSIDLVNTFSLRAASIGFSDGVSVNVSNGDVRLIATATDSPFVINVPMTASGDIEIRTNSLGIGFDVDGRLTGRDVLLSTPGAFVNDRGADAIAASGHWVIYSASPDLDTFGGLDSGNTALWGSTLATRSPSTIAGDRYVFSYQPTLMFASQNSSKVYGTDLTGSTGLPFSVAGYQTGVSGAFLGDTATSAFSGLPSFMSLGFTARAGVAGGPYVITIGQGGLQSSAGYAFSFSNAGMLTVTPKALTANVVADNKTYDATTAGSGVVLLNGVISGDVVGTSGTTFTFADKNAGAGKTVNVNGTTLTGADAGNYTLTIPASALADILKKAITANVVANSKTYDGTTAGTGTVSLNGVVGGDTVGTSGTTFTFSDKNAGTGKTVTVAGTTLTGADAGNYTVTIPANSLADILKKAITASVAVASKTYDGTTAGTGTVTLNGVVSGDNVTTSGTTFTYADKNAGTGKAVAVAGTTVGGADAGNYTITIPASALGDILKRALSVTADDTSKVQNDPDPALTYTLTSGSLVSGDAFSGNVARDTGENPGTYAIKIGTLGAGDNYTITFTPGTFTINLPLGSEGLQPALKAQPLPSQIGTGASSGSSVNLDTSAVCGDDKNCTTGNPAN